jgi:hypothetical protein
MFYLHCVYKCGFDWFRIDLRTPSTLLVDGPSEIPKFHGGESFRADRLFINGLFKSALIASGWRLFCSTKSNFRSCTEKENAPLLRWPTKSRHVENRMKDVEGCVRPCVSADSAYARSFVLASPF